MAKTISAAIAAYVAGAFLTFGWAFHHDCAEDTFAHGCAYTAGTLWPIYWGAKGAIELFRPAPTTLPEG